MTRRRSAWLAAVVAIVALVACTPLFLPPVPSDPLAALPAWRLAGDAELRAPAVDGTPRLRLRFRFDAVAWDAWVAVQWFGPTGGERASTALWVTPADVGRPFTVDAPADLEITPGAWRALISVDGRVVRQLDVLVAPPATP